MLHAWQKNITGVKFFLVSTSPEVFVSNDKWRTTVLPNNVLWKHLIGRAAGKIHSAAQSQLKWLIRLPQCWFPPKKLTSVFCYRKIPVVATIFCEQRLLELNPITVGQIIRLIPMFIQLQAQIGTTVLLQFHLCGGLVQLQSLEQGNHVSLIVFFLQLSCLSQSYII